MHFLTFYPEYQDLLTAFFFSTMRWFSQYRNMVSSFFHRYLRCEGEKNINFHYNAEHLGFTLQTLLR